MRYGFVLPGGSATEQLAQAVVAEEAGWDGIFVWEAAYGIDAWSLLSAMAVRTETIRLGTMLTPLPWRRPWKVASQALTLDEISGGRAILAVGLGAVDDALGTTDEVTDRRTRAEQLDEGIDLITGMWSGQFTFDGSHYRMDLTARADVQSLRPVQQPRIPIWVVGAWPRPKSMRRVLRCDGILPTAGGEAGSHLPSTEQVAEIRQWLMEQAPERGAAMDIVMEGETPAEDPAAAARQVDAWRDAGATWWLETRWQVFTGDEADRSAAVRERLQAGPPRGWAPARTARGGRSPPSPPPSSPRPPGRLWPPPPAHSGRGGRRRARERRPGAPWSPLRPG